MNRLLLLTAVSAFVLPWAHAEENAAADLRMKVPLGELQRYTWTVNNASESQGKENGKSVTLVREATSSMTLTLKGTPGKKDGSPVSIRFSDFSWAEKQSIGDSKAEAIISKGKIKCTEEGKVKVDSENDIGLDQVKQYQEYIKRMEEGEIRTTLDSAGRPGDLEGESLMLQTLKNGGAHGIFPILAGKEVKIGETWDDTFTIPEMGDFKLSRPATVHAKMTFVRWETKDGRKLARIDLTSAWENKELAGEDPEGMLAQISGVDCHGGGTCLFDPESGRFIEGAVTYISRYNIHGEKDAQTVDLKVDGKSLFTFTAQK